MRIIAILTLVFCGIGVFVIAQEQPMLPPWERGSEQPNVRGGTNRFPGGGQPPWGNGPPPFMQRAEQQRSRTPQRMPPERNGNADRSNRMTQMLRAMDANRNGILESSEISDNRRGVVNAIVSRIGVDPNRPINLADLERRAAAAGNNTSSRNSGNNRGRTGADRSRTSSAPVAEPLVPAFGEQKSAETPVLAFGQREVVLTPTVLNSLSAAAALQNQSIQATQPATRQSAPYDHLPADVRENTSLDWFFSYDKDRDGQLTMQEYVDGYDGVWTPAIAAEFRFLDRNGDGFATIDEVLLTLKEVDEQRAAEAAEASQESERNRPLSRPPGALQPIPSENRNVQPQPPPGIVGQVSSEDASLSDERNSVSSSSASSRNNSPQNRRNSNSRSRYNR